MEKQESDRGQVDNIQKRILREYYDKEMKKEEKITDVPVFPLDKKRSIEEKILF